MESNTTQMISFYSNGTDDYNYNDYYDGNDSSTRNISANNTEYDSYYGNYGYNNNAGYYSSTPIATAVILSIFGLILLVGIGGNILVVVIIAAVKSMHTTVNKCLFSLALADLVILSVLPTAPIQVDFTNSTLKLGKELCEFLMFYDRGAVVCSALIFFYVTIDRYFALCFPLKSRALWTGRRTYIILVAIWIISLALSYPYLHISRYFEFNYRGTSYSFCFLETSINKWIIWYDTFFSVLTVSVPIPVFLVLYGRMIHRIRSSVPKHCSGTTGNDVVGRRARGQVVVSLLVVVVIYTASQLPFSCLQIFDYHFPTLFSFSPYDRSKFTITWISRILIYVNSAANPIIYFSLSTNYRRAFLQVFSCLRKKKPKAQPQETQPSSLHVSSQEKRVIHS